MLLDCPALVDLREDFCPLVADCSGVVARLVWAQVHHCMPWYTVMLMTNTRCFIDSD